MQKNDIFWASAIRPFALVLFLALARWLAQRGERLWRAYRQARRKPAEQAGEVLAQERRQRRIGVGR